MKKYKVIEINGFKREQIDTKGKANCYGDPKVFKTIKEANNWIEKKSYKGMTTKYEIKPID